MKSFEEYLTQETIERFWSHVWIRKDDECWPYIGSRNEWNYGCFGIELENKEWKICNANRIAWAIINGKIPENKVIRHKCNYPPCCNPKHLLPGTEYDNSIDTVLAGNHNFSKLTPENVYEIKQRLARYENTGKIAEYFGVTWITIHRIKMGQTWRHIKI